MMKKFVGLNILFVFILSLMLGISANAENSAKIIHYVTENKDTVDVVVKISGEVNKLLGFTMYLPYDKNKLEFNLDSYKKGELMEGWITPNVPVSNNISGEYGVVYYTATPVLEQDLYYSVSKGEEKIVASFSFNKKAGVSIDENAIYLSEVFYGVGKKSSVVNVFQGEDIRFDIMPERFELVFTPYIENAQQAKVSEVKIVDENGNSDSSVYMANSTTKQFTAQVLPAYASDKSVIWSASGAVSVDVNGLITANSVGVGSVTVTTVDGNKTSTVAITVQDAEVKPTKVEITTSKANIIAGNVFTFAATFTPSDVTNKSIVWSVSDKNAYINSKTGMFKAIKAGNVTVTATSVSDNTKLASVEVTIHEAAPIEMAAVSASVLVPSVVYPNVSIWKDKTYTAQFMAYTQFGAPYNVAKSSDWAKYYYVEYSDNFAEKGANGISRKDNIITIKQDVASAKDLKITATLKNKADDTVVLTAESNLFEVKSNSKINSVAILGATIQESSGLDGAGYKNTYTLQASSEPIKISVVASGTVYLAYTVNNGKVIKANGDITIDPAELKDSPNKINIFVHNDNRPGASGYMLNSLIDQVKLTVNK